MLLLFQLRAPMRAGFQTHLLVLLIRVGHLKHTSKAVIVARRPVQMILGLVLSGAHQVAHGILRIQTVEHPK